ncbi:hypothetical protein VdG1_03351 [Verticillium dahliae VDG1]|nr:hypothetical protein VdG1_03351 [Verticillium dahliae VDG1]
MDASRQQGPQLPQNLAYSHGKDIRELPYVNCFSNRDAKDHKYDIAILGAPHDTTTTGRPGARYGPSGIRTGSQRKGPEWSIYTGRNPLADWATVVDCGDAHLPWLASRVSLQRLDKAHEVLAGRRAANASVSATPRILTLGGDHTTTLSALRSTSTRWGPERLILNSSVHAGVRAPLVRRKGDLRYARCGFAVVTAWDIDALGV